MYRTLFYTTTKDFRVHIYDARDPEKFEELKSIHAVSGQWTLTGNFTYVLVRGAY